MTEKVRTFRPFSWCQVIAALFGFLAPVALWADDYDPTRLVGELPVQTLDLTVLDEARDREIPIRVYLPADPKPAPCVLLSHGLGGTRETCAYLARHWAGRGYLTVALQHPGSDDSVWKEVPPAQRLAAMRKAASASNLLLRVYDVRAVLDQLESWNEIPDHPLHKRIDLDKVGMSGHSFGAQTTQAVCGMSIPLMGKRIWDERIKGAVVLSPGSPRGRDPRIAFRSVSMPWLLMTGTKDTTPIGEQTVESRLAVFEALPPGNKYEVVLDNAEHSAFTERALPGDREPRNPNHHRVIIALTTAFWDAYLRDDAAAKEWLNGPGAESVLQEKDRLQRK